jgi:hypothetical protein
VRRFWLPFLVFILSLSGVAVAADVLVFSEREQLDGFVDKVTRDQVEQRLDGALSHVDPGLVALRLQQGAQAHDFREGEHAELSEALRAALGVFDSGEQNLLQHAVKVDGDSATVTTRIGDAAYEQTVIYDLLRKDERWLVRRVRVL